MLNHTKKIKELYEDIQKKIFYMIPEKWDKLYLYASVIDMPNKKTEGELFFYYVPKGIFKKNPVNGYEIPNKFNLDETQDLKLVELLYEKIKELREEFRKASLVDEIWSNVTISIQNLKFRVEYDYENLQNNDFTSYERHVIWRVKYLGITPEQCTKEEKDIVRRYSMGAKTLPKREIYEAGIYIRDVENIIGYTTQNYDSTQNVEYAATKNEKKSKNQILLSQEEIEKMKYNKN